MQKKLSRYYIKINGDFGTLTVAWLRQVLSDNESLLTANAKHKLYELQYVLDGGMDFRVAGEMHHLSAGDLLLVPPENYHEIFAALPHTRKLVFAFDVQLTDAVLADALFHIPLGVCKESLILRQMAELLILLPGGKPSIAGLQIRCLTEAFFFELLQLILPAAELGTPPRIKSDGQNELVERIYTFIRSRLGSNFPTVNDLSETFHLSRRHLSRITVKAVGKTPRQILDEERCFYIRELLATTEYALHEIAFLSGFTSEYSLARFFRNKEGCTLSQYRKDTTRQ